MAIGFEAVGHTYTVDGVPARSVTSLLRKVGLVNFNGVPYGILAAAQLRGTTVHAAIHYYNEHDLDVAGFAREFPDYAGYLASWIRLMETGRLTTHFSEHRVASRTPRYAGTFDWLGIVDGHAALLDFATGDPEDACKHLQTAGYVLAAKVWAQEPGEELLRAFLERHPFVARFSVQLDKRGGLPTLSPYRDATDYTKFRLIAQTVQVVDEERPKSAPWEWQSDFAA